MKRRRDYKCTFTGREADGVIEPSTAWIRF